MARLIAVADSLAQPATRSPLRPHYKPTALLSVLALLDEGALDPALMDAETVISRARSVFADFDPAHELQVFQPLWHLRTNGAWSLLDAERRVLKGPEWGNYDKRPKSLAAFRRLVRFIAPTSPASWADPKERLEARQRTVALLRMDLAPVAHAIAVSFSPLVEAAPADAAAWSTDLRSRAWAQIVVRRGQAKFRRLLLEAYEGRCAVSGCDAVPVLEAAHISAYMGPYTDQSNNGLLLRADIHTLFDLHLLALDPATGRVWLAPTLRGGAYGDLHGRLARAPSRPTDAPNMLALGAHLDEARAQNARSRGRSRS